MRNTFLGPLLCTLVLSLLTVECPVAGAQETQAPPERVAPGELQRLFDAYFVANIQDALGLSDDQYSQIIPMLKHLQQVRREHQQRRRDGLRELRQLSVSAGSDDAQLREHLKVLADVDERFAQEQRKVVAGIDGLLNVRQQARFRVYEEEMERRKLDLIGRFQRNEGRPRRRFEPPRHH